MTAIPEPVNVLVSVGTDHHRFDRLMDWIERWAASAPSQVRVVVQYGTSRVPAGVRGVDLLEHEDLCQYLSAAHAVVLQGGPGGIVDSWRVGLKPIVVPRRADLGEHVDDHQVTFARHLDDDGQVLLAESETSLAAGLDGVVRNPDAMRIPPRLDPGLATAQRVASLVSELVARRSGNSRDGGLPK